MTISMIQAAMTIPKAVKDVPSINAVLIEASEVLMEKSPFFSIANTWAMAKKSKTNDELQWIMETIFNLCITFPQTWKFEDSVLIMLLVYWMSCCSSVSSNSSCWFKKCLNSPAEMRHRLGFPSGSKAVHNPDNKSNLLHMNYNCV